MKPLSLLHIDDDPTFLDRVALELGSVTAPARFRVSGASNLAEFRDALGGRPDLALIDVHLGAGLDSGGIEAVRLARRLSPETVVVMYSVDLDSLQAALVAGADDFVVKSSRMDELAHRLVSSYSLTRAKTEPDQAESFGRNVAVGETMAAIRMRFERILRSAVRAVHVHGESGTGKEVVVRLLERALPRPKKVVKVNCGAISPQLLESELFGHRRGAFTGALQDKVGYLEAASGGWIFLDEIANLSLTAQAALLRAIENQEIVRVGDHQARPIDVKVISAANVDLAHLVTQGKFRNDLLQRLQEVRIDLRPLRERRGEIGDLIDHFARTEEGGPYRLSEEARRFLLASDWSQGNARELRNAIRAMTERQVDGLLTPLSIPDWLKRPTTGPSGTAGRAAADLFSAELGETDADLPPFDVLADRLLTAMLRHGFARHGARSLRQVAEALGLPKTTLTRKLKTMREQGLVTESELTAWFKTTVTL